MLSVVGVNVAAPIELLRVKESRYAGQTLNKKCPEFSTLDVGVCIIRELIA
jgi:hypothetical protein